MKPKRVISAASGWEYFVKDYLWTVFPVVCYEAHRLMQKRWKSAKKFFEKPNETMSFFEVFFKALWWNTLVKFFCSG